MIEKPGQVASTLSNLGLAQRRPAPNMATPPVPNARQIAKAREAAAKK